MKRLQIVALAMLAFSSCKLVLGVKTPRTLSFSEYERFNRKLGISGDSYRIDPRAYLILYDSLKTGHPLEFNEISQPLQILVFDKGRANISHFVNCNIGGIPLKWNRTKSFDRYPLNVNGILEPKYKVQFEEIKSYLIPNLSEQETSTFFGNYEYVYVIFYSRFLYGFSKSMLRFVDENRQKFSDKNVKYIYVYVDDLYVELEREKQ